MFWRATLAALFTLSTFLPVATRAQEYAVHPQYENVGHFHDGIAPVMQGDLWGFIDLSGRWVLEPQFEAVKAGADRRFGVLRRGLWGYVDSAGQMAIPFRFKEAGRFSEGVAAVSENGRDFFQINASGKNLSADEVFRQISRMRDGVATVLTASGEWTAVRRGEPNSVYPPYLTEGAQEFRSGLTVKIEELTPFSEASAFFLINGSFRVLHFEQYSVISSFKMPGEEREITRTPAFAKVRRFSNGLAAVSSDGVSWGFIDRNAQFVIPPRFEGAREFSEGVAPVKLNGLWGFADRSGNIVLRPSFDRAYSFREGFATIRMGDLRGFLKRDNSGHITVAYAPQFEDVFSFQESLAPVKQGGRWGFIKAPGVDVRVLPAIRQQTALKTVRP